MLGKMIVEKRRKYCNADTDAVSKNRVSDSTEETWDFKLPILMLVFKIWLHCRLDFTIYQRITSFKFLILIVKDYLDWGGRTKWEGFIITIINSGLNFEQ